MGSPSDHSAAALARQRLAIVLSHPVQYYAPWFRTIAAGTALTIRVFYLSDHGVAAHQDAQFSRSFAWDTDLLSGYDHEFVPNTARHPDVTRFQGLKNPLLRKALGSFHPDALLLLGYAYRPHLGLLLRRPAPVIFRGDSHLLGGPPPSRLKRWLLRALYARCAAFLPVGRANAAYFSHYGVPERKLFPAPHCVDQSHFAVSLARLDEAARLRASLGIPASARVVLFAGKLMPKKRPDLLLAAFLEARTPDAHLVFSGNGELLEILKVAAAGDPHIHFLPFANQSAMPARYLLGDVFVLPSEGRHETWGLATNEAMHLERPVILSDHVGCHADLLIPGQTGWLFPAGDQAGLAGVLRQALSLPHEKLAAMGRAAAQHAAAFNYDSATAGLLAAVKSVAPNP